MRQTVVHVIDSTNFGGAEQALLTLLAGLDRSRWDPILVHHDFEALTPLVDEASAAGVPTVAVQPMPPGLEGIRRLPHFARELHRMRPSVVHLHLTWPLGCQYPLVAAISNRSARVVATVHLYVELSLSRRVMVQQRLLTRGVDRYLAVSSHIRDALIEHLGWPADKIDVVNNAVLLGDAPSADSGVRAELTRGTGRAVVLVPARLDPQKGQRHLLQAAALVTDACFVLAGDGPDRASLEAFTRSLRIEERVTFLGHRRDVPQLLAAADVVVLPSLYEGWPLAILEAMDAARPVIATRIGGVDQIITEGHDGMLVPAGDAAALAGAIRTLLDQPELRCRLGVAARATVAERFSVPVMCRQVEAVYDELLARDAGAARLPTPIERR